MPVDHRDHVALLSGGISQPGGAWADLGAGSGAFTLALAELIGPGGQITAVDRDAGALRTLQSAMAARFPDVTLRILEADFTQPIGLTGLDGIVMANSLHFVRHKPPVLALVDAALRPGGRLLLVEYNVDRGNTWVPYPFSYSTWAKLAAEQGFVDTRQIGARPSRFLGEIYSAVSLKPG